MFLSCLHKKEILALTDQARSYLSAHFIAPKIQPEIVYTMLVEKEPKKRSGTLPKYSRIDHPAEKKDQFDRDKVDAVMREIASDQSVQVASSDLPTDMTLIEKMESLMREKGIRAVALYRSARLDRKLFSKITADHSYRPSRDTCLAIVLGLHLSMEEANDLLRRAGYSLSHSDRRDVAIEFFIREGKTDIDLINCVLYRLGIKPLGR